MGPKTSLASERKTLPAELVAELKRLPRKVCQADLLQNRWEKDEEERRIKEEGKREKTALATWRKWLMGLRIIERVRENYANDADAHVAEEINPFTNPSKTKKTLQTDIGNGSRLSKGPFSYAEDEEDARGGFLAEDDDLEGGRFLSEGHDKLEAPPLSIKEETGLIDSDFLNGSPPTNSDVLFRGPMGNDDSEGASSEAELEVVKVMSRKKATTNGKKAATAISGSKNNALITSPTRRAAPKRKAASKSETAVSRFFEHESDEDGNSSRVSLTTEESAVEKPVKRKRNVNGSGPSF